MTCLSRETKGSIQPMQIHLYIQACLTSTTMSSLRTQDSILRHHCPFCGRSFDTHSNLMRHMNNPNSLCQPRCGNPLESFSSHEPSINESDFVMEVDDDSFIPPAPPTNIYSIIKHPGPIKELHGQGKSFMDVFHSDKYSQERSNNPFYPFSSRDEWQLGSYLLQSDLSNAAIDDFLKLELVSSMHMNLPLTIDFYILLDQENVPLIFYCKRSQK